MHTSENRATEIRRSQEPGVLLDLDGFDFTLLTDLKGFCAHCVSVS